MKMSSELFDHLDIVIKEIIATRPKEVKEYRHNVQYANDQFISFVWGMYRYACKVDTPLKSLIRDEGLQDAHIETALKKILIEYK